MILKEKSLSKFQSEQDRLNEIRYLYYMKKIDIIEVKNRLLDLGYSSQGASRASIVMSERGKLWRKDFIDHLNSDFKDKIIKKFDKIVKGGII